MTETQMKRSYKDTMFRMQLITVSGMEYLQIFCQRIERRR